jgi:hypothetical protein
MYYMYEGPTYPFCMTASKLRQTYSSAASLNSATELGATAVKSEHTFRAFTIIC